MPYELKSQEQCQVAYRLATHVGQPWDLESPQDFTWDGSVVHFGGLTASNAIHEIAHWLVCPKKYRHLREFGLGASPELWSSQQVKEAYAARWGEAGGLSGADKEEGLASMLGIQIERQLGWDWRPTAMEHSWLDAGEHSFNKNVRRFCRSRRFYDKGQPKCLTGFTA